MSSYQTVAVVCAAPSGYSRDFIVLKMPPEWTVGMSGVSATGMSGPQGSPGQSIVGPQGPPGQDGVSIVGPLGPMGPSGQPGSSITGPMGPSGATGPQGIPGSTVTGPQGIQGIQGLSGTTGIGSGFSQSAMSGKVIAWVVRPSASSTSVILWPQVLPGDLIDQTIFPDAAVSSLSSGLVPTSHCTFAGRFEFRLSNVSTLQQNQSAKTWYFLRTKVF